MRSCVSGIPRARKAIELNPKVYPRWWHAALGKEHYRKGEYREALLEFKNMNLPNWWWNQVELAYTYGQLGDMENARAAVTKLLELYPGFDLEKAVTEHEKFSFERPISTTPSTASGRPACPSGPQNWKRQGGNHIRVSPSPFPSGTPILAVRYAPFSRRS